MWVWDTLMRHVRGLCHNTLMEYAMAESVAPKKHQKSGGNESLGLVCKGCASGLFHTPSHGLRTSVNHHIVLPGYYVIIFEILFKTSQNFSVRNSTKCMIHTAKVCTIVLRGFGGLVVHVGIYVEK